MKTKILKSNNGLYTGYYYDEKSKGWKIVPGAYCLLTKFMCKKKIKEMALKTEGEYFEI